MSAYIAAVTLIATHMVYIVLVTSPTVYLAACLGCWCCAGGVRVRHFWWCCEEYMAGL